MTLAAVALVLIAAVIHAGWNLVSKGEHPTAAFFLAANTLGCLCLAPALILYGRASAAFPAQVWAWLGVTGLFQAIYYAALAGAYRNGDMSVAYPLARSAPAVFVALISLLLGRGHQLSTQAISGIALVAVGGFILPMHRFTDVRLENYIQVATVLALVAALGTSGYSLVDDQALRILRGTPGLPVSPVAATALFSFFEGVSSSLWLALFVVARKERRTELRHVWYTRLRRAWLTGAGIYVGYTLVLVAMASVANVSYVVALRQFGIPLGALLGILVLKEPHYLPKLVGVAVILSGLILVATG